MAEKPEAAKAADATNAGEASASGAEPDVAAKSAEVPGSAEAQEANKPKGSRITEVKLPQGWEGLSIKLRGNRIFISEVPKACFSSNLKVSDGTIRNQVDGVSVDDEVVSLNGVSPAKVIERISTKGDAWNACSTASPPHDVGSKTKFDSPPCAACDFIRRRKQLGYDVALQMWLRAVKREIQFTLGVRSGAAATGDDPCDGPELNPTAAEAAEPVKRMPLGSLEESGGKTISTVVSLQASAESSDRLEKALAKLAAQDDKTRTKKYKQASKGKGKGKEKGKGKRPTGPYLERTRLTDGLVTGEVAEWKGKYGWIKPHKPVDHPKASLHKGRLYVHQIDLEWWVKALTPGSFCRFHVYSDANSLGAEECTELKETADDADDDWKEEWDHVMPRTASDADDEGPPGEWGTRDRSRSPRRGK